MKKIKHTIKKQQRLILLAFFSYNRYIPSLLILSKKGNNKKHIEYEIRKVTHFMTQPLMNLRVDYAFKQLFGTRGNEQILMQFLNVTLASSIFTDSNAENRRPTYAQRI